MTKIHVGDTVRLNCSFTTIDDVPSDPTAVSLKIEAPDGIITTVTYAEGDITRESVGVYYYDLLIDQSHNWHWRWVGTGQVAQADQGFFYVIPENI